MKMIRNLLNRVFERAVVVGLSKVLQNCEINIKIVVNPIKVVEG